MKKLTLAVLSVGVLVGILYSVNRRQPLSDSPAEAVAEVVSAPASQAPLTTEPMMAAHEPSKPPSPQPAQARQGTKPSQDSTKTKLDAAMFNQTIDVLVSSQVGYGQKQGAWKQLLNNGKIDQAISELEQRVAANPQAAEYPAALAQAYFKNVPRFRTCANRASWPCKLTRFWTWR